MLVAALLLVLVAVGLAATAVGVVITATRGMPSLSQLQARTPAQTTVLYDEEGRIRSPAFTGP